MIDTDSLSLETIQRPLENDHARALVAQYFEEIKTAINRKQIVHLHSVPFKFLIKGGPRGGWKRVTISANTTIGWEDARVYRGQYPDCDVVIEDSGLRWIKFEEGIKDWRVLDKALLEVETLNGLAKALENGDEIYNQESVDRVKNTAHQVDILMQHVEDQKIKTEINEVMGEFHNAWDTPDEDQRIERLSNASSHLLLAVVKAKNTCEAMQK